MQVLLHGLVLRWTWELSVVYPPIVGYSWISTKNKWTEKQEQW